eukprot:TRINITY_DN10549_c0_g1_i1.p3 TRINITY_DN10549_c0_g1~~TRINITY_DN10549_c0_g1_i1.p3  ORF type:complete len:101 (+),score=6.70 TRINITY_DN10549_c0_g1_i1:531-833(+)
MIDSPVAGDNIINSVEDDTLVVTGTDGEPGATLVVTFTDGTTTISTGGTINPDGNWSSDPEDISSLNDGTITITATQTEPSGASPPTTATPHARDSDPHC